MYILHYWHVCYTHPLYLPCSVGTRVHTCAFGARANTGGQAFSSGLLSLTRAMAGAPILRLDVAKGSLWSEATRF